MEFYQLVYFKQIAESENISQSAIQLNISQPALSRSLKNLEQELGVQLFNRQGKKLVLNNHGLAFLHYANRVLDTLNEAKQKIKQDSAAFLPPLNLAVIHDNHLIPQILASFHRQYPFIHINLFHFVSSYRIPSNCTLVIHSSEELVSALPPEKSFKLLTEECLIGLSVHHPLAPKDALDLHDLSTEPFIVLSQENSFGEFSRGFFRILGIQPHIILESDSQIMIDALVAQNVGLALYPSETWFPGSDQVLLKRIRDHQLYQPLYISCNAAVADSSTELFFSHAKSYFDQTF